MAKIFHLITERDWELAQESGQWRPESLDKEGFIHCSVDEEQAMRVVARLYSERADLLALEVDTEKLHYPVISEPSRSGEIYPHIYGPLELSAIINILRVKADGQGSYALSE
jgi:uncharacterized protein (DUF952 family)